MIKYSVFFFILFLVACEGNRCTQVGSGGVCLTIVNRSGQSIEKVALIRHLLDKQCAIDRTIENNSQTCISYKAGGESSYSLLVVLENGDTIRSKERYAEGGYAITETVKRNRITPDYSNYY